MRRRKAIAAAANVGSLWEEHRTSANPCSGPAPHSTRTWCTRLKGAAGHELTGFTSTSPNGYTLGFTVLNLRRRHRRVAQDRQLAPGQSTPGGSCCGRQVIRLKDRDDGVNLHGTRTGRSGDLQLTRAAGHRRRRSPFRIATSWASAAGSVTMDAAVIQARLHTEAPVDTISFSWGRDLAPAGSAWLSPRRRLVAGWGGGGGGGGQAPAPECKR